MPKLTEEDFSYYKEIVAEDKKAHQLMMGTHLPDQIMDAYEGKIADRSVNEYKVTGNMIEDYLLIAANTIIPTLFYQMPRSIIRGRRQELSYSASVLNGLAGVYFGDDSKKEIQLCIIDAFLPYPFACMKVGYNSRTGKYSPINVALTGQTQGGNDKSMEASAEYLVFEKPFCERVSPRFTYLDSSKSFGKDRRITFEYQRTLQELIDSNLYQITSEFINYFKARNNNDKRRVKFNIIEHWCMIGGKAWKLVYTEDWHEELSWVKTPYTELPRELLRFNDLGDRVYTTSHGYLAYEAQKELSYLNDLWKQHIDHIRRQHLIDMSGVDESGKKAIQANIIDSVVSCNRPPETVYREIASTPMGKDVYAGIDNIRNYLKLLLSTSGGKGGESKAEFAYTEKQQAVGDMMRTTGMQDAIRDFARGILKKSVTNIVKYGDPEITIQITGKNVIDPVTNELITGKELQIGGLNGLRLQEKDPATGAIVGGEVKGNVDIDYVYDVDITSAQRPDFATVRAQLKEFGEFMIMLEPKFTEAGKKFDFVEFSKDFANTFDTIVDPQKYIDDMSDEEKNIAAMKMAAAQMKAMGAKPTTGATTAEPKPEAEAPMPGAMA